MYSPLREASAIDPIEDSAWLEFIEACPGATAFHHPAWLELLRRQYGYEIEACCVKEGDRIKAGIPIARISSPLTGRRLVSLPFSDACPPLVSEDAGPSVIEALSDTLAERSRESGLRLTVRAAMPGTRVSDRFVSHELALGADPGELESNISKNHRRNAGKAGREGLRAERRTDAKALDAFYALHLKTRHKLGVPTQPRRFIRRFEELFEQGLGFILMVFEGDRPIAAAVFLTYGGTVIYKYGASDPDNLKKRPNNLLFLEAIRWSCEAGFRVLDFGRTELENEGLRSFKRAWGATELDLVYSHFGDDDGPLEPESNSIGDRIISTTIQRSPPLVGRLVGEALYKHYG